MISPTDQMYSNALRNNIVYVSGFAIVFFESNNANIRLNIAIPSIAVYIRRSKAASNERLV